MRGAALKGHLDMLVLAVLSEGPLHGYSVIEQLRMRSDDLFDLPEGTVYPVLHRLEKAGLLASAWGEASGRARRTYSLTKGGKAALARERTSWQAFSSAVGMVLAGGPWSAKT